ncbi:hypothetical protein PP175_14985 [Aneurinibacillus sp. Ricciae_BoGa-3]|uniref:hypothetical protein n=1 Tax=Aneurinibacillus sp. Ricciae_BoGa-3 TaxID=3022697 RepID=UPI002341A1DA|nr:hypothetical protein [Aneurinibacillus sp. Ricciae_BoGa-3]WCK52732.1 hypothetical protein PP175_14985 [Aneurinibacillus sp. Ricciae_BoGa-3]
MWVVENIRPFQPTYGRGVQYKAGTRFIWEVADVLPGGRIMFRFYTIDSKSQCLVTMRELEQFAEVPEEILRQMLEEYDKMLKDRKKKDCRGGTGENSL